MKRAWVCVIFLTILWMGYACAQGVSQYEALRTRLDNHLITAEGKSQLLADLERRVGLVEVVQAKDNESLSQIRNSMASIQWMLRGIIVPLLVLMVKTLFAGLKALRIGEPR